MTVDRRLFNNEHFTEDEVKWFVRDNGGVTNESQKLLGKHERLTRLGEVQAPQQSWESYDDYLQRINSW